MNTIFLNLPQVVTSPLVTEAFSALCAPVDLVRGAADFFTAGNADTVLAARRLVVGAAGTLPVAGTAARFARYVLKPPFHGPWFVEPRFENEMTGWERINRATGRLQFALSHLGFAGVFISAAQFATGLGDWRQAGVLAASFAVPWWYARRARQRADQMLMANERVDHPAVRIEQLGLLPPRSRAPQFLMAPAIRRRGDVLQILYPTGGPPRVRGVLPGDKWKGLRDFYLRALGGAPQAYYSSDALRIHRIRTQHSDAILAGVGQFRAIEVRGLNHLPKGDCVMIGLNHYTLFDFAITTRVAYTLPRETGTGFHEAVTMKREIGFLPGLGPLFGLSSRWAGRALILIRQGEGRKALENISRFFAAKPLMRRRSWDPPLLTDRSVWFYGTGHRTTRSTLDFENGKQHWLWAPYHGAFNAAVLADKPLVPVSFYYDDDGIVRMQIHAPRFPGDFVDRLSEQGEREGSQGGKTPSSGRRQTAATALKNLLLEGATQTPADGGDLSDAQAMRRTAGRMREDVMREMAAMANCGGYFTRFIPERFSARFTAALGGV